MDTAIKAEWYDLDDADREYFLAWLHGHHLPALQARPGHIWIGHYNRAPQHGKSNPPGYPARVETDDPNVPRGSQYLLVTAAASPDVFFNPNVAARRMPNRSHACQAQGCVSASLSRRPGERPRLVSPLPGTGAPPAIQLGNHLTSTRPTTWPRLVVPTMKLPQVTWARGCTAPKLVSIVGWAKHGILYEFMEMEPTRKISSSAFATPA
jgi:hypothetical protein